MLKSIRNSYLLVLILSICFWGKVAVANMGFLVTQSTINNQPLYQQEELTEYSFFLAGHIRDNLSTQNPVASATFVANINRINESEALFVVLLGDSLFMTKEPYIQGFKFVMNQLEVPVFQSVGNHEIFIYPDNLDVRAKYVDNFGPTYFTFQFQSEQFIFLDTQYYQNEITGDQWNFFRSTLDTAQNNSEIKTIFIFSHQLLWAAGPERYSGIYKAANSNLGPKYKQFSDEIGPLLLDISTKKKIIWCSGDINDQPAPNFIDLDKNPMFLATGIDEHSSDAIFKVNISNSGVVDFELFPLIPSSTSRDLHDATYKEWMKNNNSVPIHSSKTWKNVIKTKIKMIAGENGFRVVRFVIFLPSKKAFWAGVLVSSCLFVFVYLKKSNKV